MTVKMRSNGDLALDWTAQENAVGRPAGPFITLTPAQYKELVKVIAARERLYGG